VACQAPTDSSPAAQVGIDNYTNMFVDELPSDIAVMSVVDMTSTKLTPSKMVRDSVRSYFLKRGYSPLSQRYLDTKFAATNASALALPKTGGVEVTIHSWDESKAYSAGSLRYDAEISVYSTSGAVLFNARNHGKVQLSAGEMGASTAGRRAAILTGQMVSALLVDLPAPPPM